MRALLAVLAVLTLATPAAADLPRIDFEFPIIAPGLDRPFTFGVRRAGDWDENALKNAVFRSYYTSTVGLSVQLDGTRIAYLPLAHYRFNEPSENAWIFGTGWLVNVPGLSAGPHQITATYPSDFVNRPPDAVWNFNILNIPVAVPPPSFFPGTVKSRDGSDPGLLPTGDVFLFDPDTGEAFARPIGEILITDPLTGDRKLDLSFLPADTVVTYGGDANYPAFNYTYDAPEQVATPAPAAPFALALLALATMRIRRRAVLHSTPCPMPTSSISASTPAIR